MWLMLGWLGLLVGQMILIKPLSAKWQLAKWQLAKWLSVKWFLAKWQLAKQLLAKGLWAKSRSTEYLSVVYHLAQCISAKCLQAKWRRTNLWVEADLAILSHYFGSKKCSDVDRLMFFFATLGFDHRRDISVEHETYHLLPVQFFCPETVCRLKLRHQL